MQLLRFHERMKYRLDTYISGWRAEGRPWKIRMCNRKRFNCLHHAMKNKDLILVARDQEFWGCISTAPHVFMGWRFINQAQGQLCLLPLMESFCQQSENWKQYRVGIFSGLSKANSLKFIILLCEITLLNLNKLTELYGPVIIHVFVCAWAHYKEHICISILKIYFKTRPIGR